MNVANWDGIRMLNVRWCHFLNSPKWDNEWTLFSHVRVEIAKRLLLIEGLHRAYWRAGVEWSRIYRTWVGTLWNRSKQFSVWVRVLVVRSTKIARDGDLKQKQRLAIYYKIRISNKHIRFDSLAELASEFTEFWQSTHTTLLNYLEGLPELVAHDVVKEWVDARWDKE